MSAPNLPPGCSVNDIPGNRPAEVAGDRYNEEHITDMEMFREWLEDTLGVFIVSDPDKHDALLELSEGRFADEWSEHLYAHGARLHMEGRA